MNTQENQIAGTPSAPAKKKVSYGKLSPEAKAALGRMSAESKEMLTTGVDTKGKGRVDNELINYKMPGILSLLWWLWNIGLTLQMVGRIAMVNSSKATLQMSYYDPDIVWIDIIISWVANLILARLAYEIVSAVFEILNRLREQGDDMCSVKQVVESLQQRQKVNAHKE